MKQRTAPRWSRTTVGALATVLVAAATVPASATAAHTPASLVAKPTGVDSVNNTYNLWDIKGTDLGIMWDDGPGQVLTAFGVTFGAAWIGPGGGTFGSGTPCWRSNVLLRSSDGNLADGMSFASAVTDANGLAREALPGVHNARYDHGWQDVHQTVPVTPGANYRLTAWLRTASTSDNGFLGVRDTAGAVNQEAHFTSVGSWTRYTASFNSGSRSSVDVYGGVWTDHGDTWIQLDDFSLTKA